MKSTKHSNRRPTASDKQDTAIHEAAHTIVALYFGHEVGDTSIVGNKRQAGTSKTKQTRSFHADIPINYFALEEEIVICMAGKEANARYRQETGQKFEGIDYGDGDDLEEADSHARQLKDAFTGEGKERCLKRLRQVTAVVVNYGPVWDAIHALARALLESDIVPADKSHSIFKQAIGVETVRMPLASQARQQT